MAEAPRIPEPQLETRGLSVEAPGRTLLRGVDLAVPANQVFVLIGPSGAGKSTLLRCFNRLIELTPELRVRGEVRFQGEPIYAPGADPDVLRARIGILFQQPVVFPASILENTLFGLRHLRTAPRREHPERAEQALASAGLWEEVKDRLREPATVLSVGQRQRLCLARALAVEPQVLLMDEPTSALDPRSTEVIEDLVRRLAERLTVVLVTHDLGQARRVADTVACLYPRDGVGELVEVGGAEVFSRPRSVEMQQLLRPGRV